VLAGVLDDAEAIRAAGGRDCAAAHDALRLETYALLAVLAACDRSTIRTLERADAVNAALRALRQRATDADSNLVVAAACRVLVRAASTARSLVQPHTEAVVHTLADTCREVPPLGSPRFAVATWNHKLCATALVAYALVRAVERGRDDGAADHGEADADAGDGALPGDDGDVPGDDGDSQGDDEDVSSDDAYDAVYALMLREGLDAALACALVDLFDHLGADIQGFFFDTEQDFRLLDLTCRLVQARNDPANRPYMDSWDRLDPAFDQVANRMQHAMRLFPDSRVPRPPLAKQLAALYDVSRTARASASAAGAAASVVVSYDRACQHIEELMGRVVCVHCFLSARQDVPLGRCGRCKAVAYCSTECQRAAWPHHRVLCDASGRLAAAAQRAALDDAGRAAQEARREGGSMGAVIASLTQQYVGSGLGLTAAAGADSGEPEGARRDADDAVDDGSDSDADANAGESASCSADAAAAAHAQAAAAHAGEASGASARARRGGGPTAPPAAAAAASVGASSNAATHSAARGRRQPPGRRRRRH
jgi:hypothetical protein